MKKQLFVKASILILFLFSSFFLVQCELILGSPENVNVGIDLSGFLGNGASRGISSQYTVTEIHVSVFGPGMQPLEKIVSPNIPGRTVNLYVPAGEDRHFTVEVFIVPDAVHPHVVSYIGRATADLRPGRYTGLKIRMVAGATQLLAPDRSLNRIFWSNDIVSFNALNYGTMGGAAALTPGDLDVAADGRLFAAHYAASPSIVYGNSVNLRTGELSGPSSTTALAMDRDFYFNINRDAGGVIETNVMYLANSTSLYFSILDDTTGNPSMTPRQMVFPTDIAYRIRGMDVDPWTHRLYIVGYYQASDVVNIPLIIEYDPFYYAGGAAPVYGQIVKAVLHPTPGTFQDVIVKDERIFVLNNVAVDDLTTPVLLVFDKNLNYLSGFGRLSSNGAAMVESVAPGMFYRPKRFIAHENDGLYIVDDSDETFDKIVFINTNLDPGSWRTFPPAASVPEPFNFIE